MEIPIDGFGQTGLKALAWLPAKLSLSFGSIDRVAMIVARSVNDELNAVGMASTV